MDLDKTRLSKFSPFSYIFVLFSDKLLKKTERMYLDPRSSGLWKHTMLTSSRPFFQTSEDFLMDLCAILGWDATFHRIP